MRLKIAKILSRVFEPIIEIPLILTAVTMTAYANGYRWRFLALILFLDAVIPGLYFFYLLKSGKAKDWDITKRVERLPLFRLAVVTHFIGVVVGFLIGREPLAQILLALWLLAVVFSVITQFWKVSLHAGVNSALAVLAIMLYGWQLWWLLLLPVVVSWARIEYKKHSLSQVVVGTLIPMILLPLLFQLFGII